MVFLRGIQRVVGEGSEVEVGGGGAVEGQEAGRPWSRLWDLLCDEKPAGE